MLKFRASRLSLATPLLAGLLAVLAHADVPDRLESAVLEPTYRATVSEVADRLRSRSRGAAAPAVEDAAYESFQRQLKALNRTGSWSRLSGVPGWRSAASGDLRERYAKLAFDPAKGRTVPGGLEEAAVGVFAERTGIVPAPITRETSGRAEFVDGEGRFWDVKSPVSPWPGQGWTFDAQHQVEKVLHDISQDNRVLLNLSHCSVADAEAVLARLIAGLTAGQRSMVYVLRTREVLAPPGLSN